MRYSDVAFYIPSSNCACSEQDTLEIRVMMQIGDISPEILDLHSSCLFPQGISVENVFQIHFMK